ncbi:carbamoyl phosphate synthase [Acrocarpospora pleiomorpha]|uniref:Carbamoyl phosphate synthase n=1 Tax=Acrocarpospora pleiomorpha TaxID=90975 RepID=A0A5M3XLG6_9ACTN|nr:ATP-grasp domain-containing protein [Acrocarpospora pleiomorpha]GES20491.1 carbamoyl phosphate synthase [Acrocarpospora pleiomorpha]
MAAEGPLLVLGAGEEQLPLFREARLRGLRTIAVDWRDDRPGVPLADRFLRVSTRDHAAVVAALGEIRPSGVVSAGSDMCLLSWHELSRRYGTPHIYPRAAADASMDKAAFHRVARSAGLPGYRWAVTRLAEPMPGLEFPVVVKPVDASGGKGVALVREPSGLVAALAAALAHSVCGEAVVEEFREGRNITVEVFLRDGEVAFSVLTEKRVIPGPGFLIGGHTCPAPIEAESRQRIVAAALRLCAAMGWRDGPAHFDVILAPDGTPYVLEVGARLCGNGYPRLTRAVYGVDTVGALIALALGEPFDLTPQQHGHGIIHVLRSPYEREGVLARVEGLDEVRALPGVADAEVVTPAGAPVHPFTQSGHKLGYLVVTGDSADDAESTLKTALATLRLMITPGGGPR